MSNPLLHEPRRDRDEDPLYAGNVGLRPRGFFATAGEAWEFATAHTWWRWSTLGDFDSPQIPFPEFKELASGRSIQWFPGMTRRMVESRIEQYDYDLEMSQYQHRPVAELLGMMPPLLADPVTLLTLPVGATSFGRAVGASGVKAFFKESLIGGAQVGAASLPLEIAVHMQAYGEVRPDILAGATLGPIALAPLGTGLAKGIKHLLSPREMSLAARLTADDPTRMDMAVAAMRDGDVPMPPLAPHTPPEPPQIRLQRQFDDYEGGAVQWVRDLSQHADRAVTKAMAMGLDPEHPAIRDLITRQARVTMGRPLASVRHAEEVFDFVAAVHGRATPEQVERLRSADLLDEVERTTTSLKQEVQRGEITQAEAQNRIEAVEKQLGEITDPTFASMRAAYRKPAAQRTAKETQLLKQFEQYGGARARAVHLNQLEEAYEAAAIRASALQEQVRTGKATPEILSELQTAIRERSNLWLQREAILSQLRTTELDVPAEQVMAALEVASYDAPNTRYAPPRPTRGNLEAVDQDARARAHAAGGEDPELKKIEDMANKFGVDVATARSVFDSVDDAIRNC